MFDKITGAFQKVFKQLRGYGKLSESNIQEALREVRLALLEADVNYQVVKDFIARVKAKSLGQEVLESIQPGQQFVKHVYDEMVALLGGTPREVDLAGQPARVLLLGLNGVGKTTTAGKLALRWRRAGKKVLLCACDLRRPMAAEQLRLLAGKVGVDVVLPEPGETLPALGQRARARAVAAGDDVVLYDSGGRFQIDTELVAELQELRDAVAPTQQLLVLDAAIGQESVHVAETFQQQIGLTGLILTKLDGDARGGAALSVQAVTHCPILLIGTGEKLEDLDAFYPERMASRILGMGDVVGLVEKAQQAVDAETLAELEQRMQSDHFDLEDFLAQLQQMKKLGPLENLLEMLPGVGNVPAHDRERLSAQSSVAFRKSEAVIRSMTPWERRHPDRLDASRKRRIARGSGTAASDVNELLRNFDQARRMMQQMKKARKKLLRFGK